jgi:hypothetical protein
MRTLFELITEVVRMMTFQQASRTGWSGKNSDRPCRCEGVCISCRAQ